MLMILHRASSTEGHGLGNLRKVSLLIYVVPWSEFVVSYHIHPNACNG